MCLFPDSQECMMGLPPDYIGIPQPVTPVKPPVTSEIFVATGGQFLSFKGI